MMLSNLFEAIDSTRYDW